MTGVRMDPAGMGSPGPRAHRTTSLFSPPFCPRAAQRPLRGGPPPSSPCPRDVAGVCLGQAGVWQEQGQHTPGRARASGHQGTTARGAPAPGPGPLGAKNPRFTENSRALSYREKQPGHLPCQNHCSVSELWGLLSQLLRKGFSHGSSDDKPCLPGDAAQRPEQCL